MVLLSYLRVALATTWNVILNALTLGRYVWLEGRVRDGLFQNWGRGYRHRPRIFAQPETEAEIVQLVRGARQIRVFGSAHSFNRAIMTEDTLVSLDRFSGVVRVDREKKQLTVRAGTRVRDVVAALLEEGWAFAALPSHDAQSIAGILSTDVHGTGRDWGFVSEAVAGLKIVDGRGTIHECGPNDDLFRAAIGGVGAVGIITEVVVQGVDRFNVEQKTLIGSLSEVAHNLDAILEENDHVSLYVFPFTDRCQINTWNRTTAPKSFLGPLREFISISKDALVASWLGAALAYSRLLPRVSTTAHGIKRGTDLVLESNKAFNRTIYHLHQELEFAVPFAQTIPAIRRFMTLYEELYEEGLPYMIFEVRFTPAGHDRTLIGPGHTRRSTWIDLVCNDCAGYERYYAAAEAALAEMDARPHLGKYCGRLDQRQLARLHGENFTRFQALARRHDPDGKFVNAFTRRVLGLGDQI